MGLNNPNSHLAPLLIFLGLFSHTHAAEINPSVVSWLTAQTNLQAWSADFVQTRTLKSLVQPLTATGHVWFAAPNRFRWELGQPPKTIALRAPTELLVSYPALKRVERYPLKGGQKNQWSDALSLLEAGFPRSQRELESHFHIRSQSATNHLCELVLQPRSTAARKMMPQLIITFDTRQFSLLATQLQFADGSTLHNDFMNATLNPQLEAGLFTPNIPPDFKVSEPLKQHE